MSYAMAAAFSYRSHSFTWSPIQSRSRRTEALAPLARPIAFARADLSIVIIIIYSSQVAFPLVKSPHHDAGSLRRTLICDMPSRRRQ
jgi:hypothetical protein